MERPRLRSVAVLAVLALAAALRVWGIDFGLPHRYHIDEPYYVVGALRLAQGDFNLTMPHNTPNLWQFLLLAEYGALFLVGRMVGVFGAPNDVANLYVTDPSVFYLLARLSSAAFGVATTAVVIVIGRRLFGRRAGILAGAMYAVAFLPVRDAHYAVNDALVVFLTTYACLAAVAWHADASESQSGPSRRLLALGWLAVGAATGMKYRPAAFALPIMAAVLIRARESGRLNTATLSTELGRGIVFGGLGLLVGFPGLVLNAEQFVFHLQAAAAQAGVSYEGWVVDALPGWAYYLRMLAIGAGLPMLAAALVGLMAAGRPTGAWLLVAGAAAYYVSIAPFHTYFARYILPVFPMVAVLAGGGLIWLWNRRPRGTPEPLWRLAIAGVGLLAIGIPLSRSLRHNHLLTQTDTRSLAKAWIEDHAPEGSLIAVDWPIHGPPLATAADPEPNSARAYDVWVAFGKGLGDRPLEDYEASGVDYLVTSSFISQIDVVDADLRMRRQAFYSSLPAKAELVAEFLPYGGDGPPPDFVFDQLYGPVTDLWRFDRPGPVLRVYRLD